MEGERTPSTMTVFQYKSCNALLLKPFGHLGALRLFVEPEITASWADDDAAAGRVMLRDIGSETVGRHKTALQKKQKYDEQS